VFWKSQALHTFCVGIVQPSFGVRIRKLRLEKGLSQLEQRIKSAILSEERAGCGNSLFLFFLRHAGSSRSLFDYSENEEFLKRGGLKVRASQIGCANSPPQEECDYPRSKKAVADR